MLPNPVVRGVTSESMTLSRPGLVGIFVGISAMIAAACSTTPKESSRITSTTAAPSTEREIIARFHYEHRAPATPASTVALPELSLFVEPQAGLTPIYNFMSSGTTEP